MPVERLGDVSPHIDPSAWVHPTAVLIGNVVIGADASVWPGAILRGDAGPVCIGARTSIQDNVVCHGVGGGVIIGEDCVVGHLAFLEECIVEDACLIGIGSKVLNNCRVGTGATVAAGAVLVQALKVPAGMRAQGVPAKLVEGTLTSSEIREQAAVYTARAARYKAEWSAITPRSR